MVTSPERSLQILYCSFGRNHRGPYCTGGRDVPIYTAGWTGAMRASSLLKRTAAGVTDTTGDQTWDLAITRMMSQPQNCTVFVRDQNFDVKGILLKPL